MRSVKADRVEIALFERGGAFLPLLAKECFEERNVNFVFHFVKSTPRNQNKDRAR